MQSDHKPLEIIFKKDMNNIPKRLQRMRLRLQKYDVNVYYTKGDDMHIADTLSRAFIQDDQVYDGEHESVISHIGFERTTNALLSETHMDILRLAMDDDIVLKKLKFAIMNDWNISDQDKSVLKAYMIFKDELLVEDEYVYKGNRLIIPKTMRPKIMELIHQNHMGIESCLRMARESIYWPRMNAEIKDMISKCDVCNTYRPCQQKEELNSTKFAMRPWSTVAMDIFELDGKCYHVIVDFYSNFFELNELSSVTSRAIISAIRPHFARHGIPDIVITDNGPQYVSWEFEQFSQSWGFQHQTSSPRYPQGNGKAENCVKTVKNLLKKSFLAGSDPLLAILDWRNTPTEGLDTSPAQRLMSRRTRTRLPTTSILLSPEVPDVHGRIRRAKERQGFYYNRHAKNLPQIKPGQNVRMQLPNEVRWSVGICRKRLDNRSYLVEVNGRVYRRNRRHLRMEYGRGNIDDSDSESVDGAEERPCSEVGLGEPAERVLRDRATLRAPDRLMYEHW